MGKLTIKQILKSKREEKNLTQKEMADFLDIPYSTYCQYEQGFKVGSKHIVKVLCKLFVDVKQLEEK